MNADLLKHLLEQLARGDQQAAEQVFLTYEPYLRMVVRRQLSNDLRAKFDSVDIVQSVWADVLGGFREARWSFSDPAQLRAFLVKAARNRFIDRVRQHGGALRHERPLVPEDLEQLPPDQRSRPSEVAQADELWEQMLAACPPAHQQILLLKRQGKSLDEIACQTGMHKSSVRRILYDVARRLNTSEQRAERL